MAVGTSGGDAVVPLVPGRLAAHATCLLQKLGQVVFRLMEAELAGLGLRVRHYSVLGVLLDRGRMSQQDIGTYLRIDAATMVATIDDLEKRSLVRRNRREDDRRSYVVTVTPDGEKVIAQIEEVMDRLDAELLPDVTPAQQRQLHHLLAKLSGGPTLTRAYDGLRGPSVQ
jgi:DNA-binding MarR family transcriptional regulator